MKIIPRFLNHWSAEEIKQWLAIRKEAGLKIDPQTAEVFWTYTYVLDPYGVYPDLEELCIGRSFFARSPGSDVWVEFGDLTEATRNALWEKINRGDYDKGDLPF